MYHLLPLQKSFESVPDHFVYCDTLYSRKYRLKFVYIDLLLVSKRNGGMNKVMPVWKSTEAS